MKQLYLTAILAFYSICAFAQPGLTKYDINKKYSSYFVHPLVHNDILFFEAYADSVYGEEGYKYDNVNFPSIIKDHYKGAFSGRFFPIYGYQDSVYFLSADSVLYNYSIFKYDMVNDTITYVTGKDLEISYKAYAGTGGKLFYYGYYDTDTTNRYVFEYDITTATTDTIFRLPFTDSLAPHTVNKLTRYNNTLYINEGDGLFNNGLYTYNINTKQIDTVVDRVKYQVCKNMAMLNNKVYFSMYDSLLGFELYEYDGNNAPKLITDYHAGVYTTVIASEDYEMVSYNNEIYFTGYVAPGSNSVKALMKYSPATNQITPVHPTVNHYSKEFLVKQKIVYNNKLYMNATDPYTGWELYVYDGAKVPFMAVEIAINSTTIPRSAHIHDFIEYKGDLFFGAYDADADNEMYRYNDSLLSISKLHNNSTTNITAYPNPTSADAQLSMTLKQAATLHILLTDINGRVVYRNDEQLYSKGKHNITLPMQRLSSGTYIYTVLDNSGQLTNSGRVLRK